MISEEIENLLTKFEGQFEKNSGISILNFLSKIVYFDFWTCLAFEKYYHHIVIFIDQPSYQGPIQIPIFSVAEEFCREEKRREVNHPEIEEKKTSKKSAIKSVHQCRAQLSCGLYCPSISIIFSTVAFLAIIQQLIKRK